MKRSIRIKESIIFYDYPQVFVGKDQLGSEYLCYIIDDQDFRFICTLLSRREISSFRFGEKSLREVVRDSEISEHYFINAHDLNGGFNEVDSVSHFLDDHLLPTDIVRLKPFRVEEDSVLTRARTRNSTVLQVALEAPESEDRLQIESDRLKEFLSSFGGLVRQAYKRALRNLSQAAKDALDISDGSKMHVVGIFQGSFALEIESAKEADLFGYSELSRAFEMIDRITSDTENPQKAIEVIKEFKGHFAGSYGKFLEFMVKNQTSVRYCWAHPNQSISTSRCINYKSISELLDLMNQSEQIGIETVTLVGRVQKADSRTRSWRVESEEDGKLYSGTVDKDSSVSVDGITIESKRYRLICEERIEESVGTGREKNLLYLVSIEEL